jgi:4-alpha-glucanotransferase
MMTTSQRSAGILLPAFSPRRERDLGIGDTRALMEWIDWAGARGVGFLQLLPINETGSDNSPYNAISSVALDPVYLSCDPGDLPGVTAGEWAAARAELGEAANGRLVSYDVVRAVKRRLLESAWSEFSSATEGLRLEFEKFHREEAGWLDEYCLFRWLMERSGIGEAWDLWPQDYSHPVWARAMLEREREVAPGVIGARLGFFAWVQWLCFRQWRAVHIYAGAKGVKLMGDIPIGVSWYSADVFFHQEDFDLQWCGGAPPETMFRHDRFIQRWGQNWGIPLYQWDKMQAEGFPWWTRRISKLTEVFHIFRIDHILGFYRIYAFPWRPQRNDEFLELTQQEAVEVTGGKLPGWSPRPDDTEKNKAANLADGDVRLRAVLAAAGCADVVGEDLGCVPEYVRPHLESLGIAGFRIPHWDCDANDHAIPGKQLPECSFATYATHDHDTIAAMWRDYRAAAADTWLDANGRRGANRNLRLLAEFAGVPIPRDGEWPEYGDIIQWSLTKALLASRARYAALMVTDLFGLTDRYNRPGTVCVENWSLRIPWTLKQIEDDPALRVAGVKLRGLIGATGRSQH